jgi:SAM-dependent methyltransferase
VSTPPAITVWDYSGIVAAAYDQFFGSEPYWDQAFFTERIRANGGAALELACGTGRLLLPLLRDGLAVEGLDTSTDMLAILRRKAAALGLSPVLHQQPMQSFDLPARYRTIFIPAGTLHIVVGDDELAATLDCCLGALQPGGELLVPLDDRLPTPDPPGAWRERRCVHVAEYGADLRIDERHEIDADGLVRWQLRYEVTRAGVAPEVFMREHRLRHHDGAAFAALLASRGFVQVATRRGYTGLHIDDPAGDVIFSARRPVN